MYIENKRDADFFWWRLKARNHRILATSEGYSRARDARRAAKTVASALGLKVIDRTK